MLRLNNLMSGYIRRSRGHVPYVPFEGTSTSSSLKVGWQIETIMVALRDPRRIRVLIIAPDNMSGELLGRSFRQRRKHFTVKTMIGTSGRVLEQLNKCKGHDVAVISAELPDHPHAGLKVLHKLRKCSSKTAPIMLLKAFSQEILLNSLRLGARGVFYRSHSLKALVKCVTRVAQGQIWISSGDLEHLLGILVDCEPFKLNNAIGSALLTPREHDVVRLVISGLKNREIADKLGVTAHSIRNYVYRIFDKVGVSSRTELMLQAFSSESRTLLGRR